MKTAALLWATLAHGVVVSHPRSAPHALSRRGQPDAPDGYTPVAGDCPDTRPSVRRADSLADEEASWRQTRIPNTVEPLRDFLGRVNITGFDAAQYITDNADHTDALPKIAIAASGGGYRALMNSAGAMAAFDSRTDGATASGQLGGLLQSALYVAGLSGGSWMTGTIFLNNFTSVQDILQGELRNVWEFENSVFQGPDAAFQLLSTADYFGTLIDQIQGKEDAGFNTTVSDLFGRALGFQLINAPNGGPAYTWSSIAKGDFITQGTSPLPIIIADERPPGQLLIPDNTTIVEFTPFEMGSWDPTIYGFIPTQFVGSSFDNGELPSGQQCVRGYDSASFVIGTSSSLFNQFALMFNGSDLPDFVNEFITNLLRDFTQSEEDIASWVNPFFNYRSENNPTAATRQLTLVDGGSNNENIPFHPLVQPVREIDVIFAIDSSADTTINWPNGSALVYTYERSLGALQNGTAFPAVPDTNTFINLGLNLHPTFFGCDGNNRSNPNIEPSRPPPLIVYIPNSPYNAFSNVSTFDLAYDNDVRNAVIQNGYNVATQGNGTTAPDSNFAGLPSDWPTCVGCAILRRSLDRTNTEIPEVCNECFTNYCWNGTLAPETPAPYQPNLALNGENVTDVDGDGNDDGDDGDNAASFVRPSIALTALTLAISAALVL